MNNNHIIIGYGNWAKKIINFLKINNFFKRIIVVTRKRQFFIFPTYKKIDKKDLNSHYLTAQSVHICSSNQSHFFYIKKFANLNKSMIVEKPFLNHEKDFQNINKIYKKNIKKIFVNYTDLYNFYFPRIKKIICINKNDKIKLNIYYTGSDKKFKKKTECVSEWLDHPLSIILEIFKSFPKFKIINFKSFYKNKTTHERLEVQYRLNNICINFIITNIGIKKRLINIKTSKKFYSFNLNNHLIKNKKSSFYKLYQILTKTSNAKNSFGLLFHKKIFKEKLKIIKRLN